MNRENDIAESFVKIKNEVEKYENLFTMELTMQVGILVAAVKNSSEEIEQGMADMLEGLIHEKNFYVGIYLYSAIIEMCPNPIYIQRFLEYVNRQLHHFTPNSLYFIYTQIAARIFINKKLETEQVQIQMWQLFQIIVQRFQEENELYYSYIPREERDENFILVLTEQVLGEFHGPTKTAFDRAKVIVANMKKETLIINTGETLSVIGQLPWFCVFEGTYSEAYSNLDKIEWKGCTIPFLQCENNMPDGQMLRELLDYMTKRKPLCIVCIGGTGILASLSSQIAPTVTINLCPSDIARTNTAFQAVGAPLTEEQKRILQGAGVPEESVIESVFTYSFIEPLQQYTRQQFGIKEDSFLIAVVGARLNVEVRDDFCQMLNEIVSDKIEVAFAGNFENYDEVTDKFSNLKAYSYHVGYIEDLPSFSDICDLYINPIRKGAGGSILEMMEHGVPAITTEYGDAASNAGPDFWVKDYQEMQQLILKYYTDKEFYREKVEQAKRRTAQVVDNSEAFMDIIEQVLEREANGYI